MKQAISTKSEQSESLGSLQDVAQRYTDSILDRLLVDKLDDFQRITVLKLIQLYSDIFIDLLVARVTDPEIKDSAKLIKEVKAYG